MTRQPRGGGSATTIDDLPDDQSNRRTTTALIDKTGWKIFYRHGKQRLHAH